MTTQLFVNLPCPAANGSGAAVDVSELGLTKTFVASGIGVSSVVIEINNALLSTDGSWAPLIGFTSSGAQTIPASARWARATVSGYKSGTPQIDVGAIGAAATFAILDVPSASGHGAAVDASALPKNKTVTVGNTFTGQVIIEISTDGTSTWEPVLAFSSPGQKSFEATAEWMRVSRTSPGGGTLPIVAVGGSADVSTGFGSIVYGSGQDGVADFDGVNTFAFASLVGTTYTLTRDIFMANGSRCRAGIDIATGGFHGFTNGRFTNDGDIHNDGKDAVGVTAGGASAVGTTGVGTPGGNGHTGVGVGSNGSNQQGANTLSDASAAGGAGGAGGADAGGTGGTYVTSNTNGGANYLVPMLTGFLFTQQSGGNTASINLIGGGSGGGGGGSDNAGVNGGGGGGGAGVVIWHAAELVNNGSIRARGGAGAAAAGAGGNGGGGGGGGGGVILSVAGSRSGSGTYDVPGGTGGAKIGAGGVAGVNGNDGHKNLFSFP